MKRLIDPPPDALHRLRTPLTDGEWRVFEFFDRLLPPGWEIYIQPHLNGLRPDFVLLHPNAGIAVFEVKDWELAQGRYEYRQDDTRGGLVFHVRDSAGNECADGRDPLRTIRGYYEEVYELYCPRLDRRAGKALITAGLIFTEADRDQVSQVFGNALQRYKEPRRYPQTWPISSRDDLQAGNVRAVFPKAYSQPSRYMTPEVAEDLRTWLREPSVAADQRMPFRLDARQRELVETRTRTGYRRIKGPAGSGKSLVLAALAAELSAKGGDVLVVSFNVTLLNYLRDRAVQWRQMSRRECDQITWLNFHYWCKRVCREAGHEHDYRRLWAEAGDDNAKRSEVLDEQLASLVNELLSNAHNCGQVDTYDAILVDEGQDFRLSWWEALRRVLRPGGEMVLVADATQDLYGTAGRWTDEAMTGAGFRGEWTRLEGNYRIPESLIPRIRDFASRFIPAERRDVPRTRQMEFDHCPCKARWIQTDPGHLAEQCVDAVLHASGWLGSAGSNADIVFLASSNPLGRRVAETLAAKDVRMLHTFDCEQRNARQSKLAFFMGDSRMKGTTIHSFKGWETRMLIVGVEPRACLEAKTALYVALTRVKRHERGSIVIVVCAEPSLAEYGATWSAS
jgi:hypothetical protein